ncbi:MFS transporter [Gordonia zhaorongruii]|uniref:MFS transporter n=1 Tax=Gordonia zhaorongruii TaxID=2597659 RepID=UPI001F48622D|nr:MFS transporter [Gordonia zhaorongruii]
MGQADPPTHHHRAREDEWAPESNAREIRRFGTAATVAFALLTVGSNLPGPLLPIYRDQLGLSTFSVTALFAVYLFALVATFTVIAGTPMSRYSASVLPIAVLICITSDAALIAGHDTAPWLFVGRILNGIAVGLGTGAIATLVLVARGERGRTIAATGTLAGSFLGLAGSAVIAQYLPWPTVTVYGIHIGALAVALLALAATLRRVRSFLAGALRAPAKSTTPPPIEHVTVVEAHPPETSLRLQWAGYTLGIAGWAIGGIVVGLLPTVVADELDSASIITTALAPIVLIGTACLSPMLLRSLRPGPIAATIAISAVACTVGVWLGSLPVILTCCLAWGVGQGFAYAAGLRIVTAGLSPVDQGRIASRFASACYGFTGVLSMGTGLVVTAFGIRSGMVVMATTFVILCTVTIVLGRGRWPGPR